MKRKKILFCIIMLTATLLLTNTVIGITEIATLDYREIDIVGINGERTLTFNNSDTGTNDVGFLWRIYDSSTNITVYMIKSQEISYNHDFINNTKTYTYTDNNTGEQFSIAIDYSSIHVPESLYATLNETIARQNETITELQNELSDCYLQIEALNQTITNIQVDLATWMTLAEQYHIELEQERLNNTPLNDEITRLNIRLDNATNDSIIAWNKVNDLEGELNREQYKHELTKNAFSDVVDPFSIGYHYQGEDRFYLNAVSIIIGIMGALFVIIFYGEKIRDKLKIFTGKKNTEGVNRTKQKRGMFAKTFGLNDARDYDELPVTDHPTLQRWRDVTPDPIKSNNPQPAAQTESIKPNITTTKGIDDIRKNIDIALNNNKDVITRGRI